MNRYYILDGHRVAPVDDVLTWGRWLEAADQERIVAKTNINGAEVSTVFIGLNHSYRDDGPPLIFETMIFRGLLNEHQERCSTWEEAEAMHKRACAMAAQTS